MIFIPNYGFLFNSLRGCLGCSGIKPATRRHFHKGASRCISCIRERDAASYAQNPQKILTSNAAWAVANPGRKTAISRRWDLNNPERRKAIRDRKNKKSRSTPEGRIADSFRVCVRIGLRGAIKTSKSEILLGCSFAEFKAHLEHQFSPEMSWENYGAFWEIDHILPVSAFVLKHSEEQELCFNWANQRPLSARENLAKRDKIL